MHELHHEIVIHASPVAVYDALTTQVGIQGWWMPARMSEPAVGAVMELSAPERPCLRLRIDELRRPARVAWYCLGDDEAWRDTRLFWRLSPKDGSTLVQFLHAYWRSPGSAFARANTDWGRLLHQLKTYLEKRKPVAS